MLNTIATKMPTLRSVFLKRTAIRMATVKLVRMNRVTTNMVKPMLPRLTHSYSYETASDGQGESGFIKGRTLEKNVPVSRRVMCYHKRTGRLIAKTWSDSEGYFEFNNLEPGVELYITSIDNDGGVVNHAAVTQDLLTAVSLT